MKRCPCGFSQSARTTPKGKPAFRRAVVVAVGGVAVVVVAAPLSSSASEPRAALFVSARPLPKK
ncbi:MAG: hypothetical protein LBT53_06860 [Puniceicoccales bacterium]|jgi:hypothetical protein|nr:hypothetical protein [Puniceicoccales bacterium]